MGYPARRIVSWVGAALVTAGASHVAADGWKIQLQGVKALGSSYAGRSVLTDDASAVWFNPACMTGLDGNLTLTAGAPLITYQLLFHDAGSRSVLGQPLQGPATQDGGTTAVVPSIYVVKRLNDRVRLGLGFNAPFGLGTDYGESWVGRYQATQTTLRVFNLNPSVATRVGGGLSLAVGLDVQRSSATIANMLDFGSFGAAAGLPLVPQQDDGRVKFDGTDWAVGWNAGALWKPRSGTRVGVAFRSEIRPHAPRPCRLHGASGCGASDGRRSGLRGYPGPRDVADADRALHQRLTAGEQELDSVGGLDLDWMGQLPGAARGLR